MIKAAPLRSPATIILENQHRQSTILSKKDTTDSFDTSLADSKIHAAGILTADGHEREDSWVTGKTFPHGAEVKS